MTTKKEGGSEAKKVPVGFGEVTEKNVELVRTLNEAMFPVSYNKRFYEDLVLPERKLWTLLAYYGYDVLAGAICCRVEAPTDKDPAGTGNKLYIMTLAVLGAYQHLGIGSQLLTKFLESPPAKATVCYLHVQTSNTGAIEFYKRFGFEVTGKIEGYYKRIDPPDCFILSKPLTPPKRK